MRSALAFGLILLAWSCDDRAPKTPQASAVAAPASGHQNDARTTPSFPLRISGTGFSDSAGRPFEWRGVSAFRLAEMISVGREAEVVRYLDWAASQNLNVVRVLLMARHLFTLTPEAGRAALPRLLDLAKARGIAVEVVALADTNGVKLDYEAHIREVGRIAGEKGNAFVEIANEPGHQTQDPRLHDPAFVARLAAILPQHVMVALGSAEYDDAYAAGDYATFHFPRERDWGSVLALQRGAAMVGRWQKPLINDEPIGASAEYREGRRDNSPARFGAAAALAKFAGMGSTFHYEGGLQARLPDQREASCLDAWMNGLALVPDALTKGEFLQAQQVSALGQIDGARATFARQQDGSAAMLLIDPSPSASIRLADGWKEQRRSSAPGVLLLRLRRGQTP